MNLSIKQIIGKIFLKFKKLQGKDEHRCQCTDVQYHAYVNERRHTYVRDVCQLFMPELTEGILPTLSSIYEDND